MISIIALLISILLPALSAARESARRVQCGSQLRQVQMALLNYAYDYDGSLPHAYTLGSDGTTASPNVFWSSKLAVTEKYLPVGEMYWCPSRDEGWYGPLINTTGSTFMTNPEHYAWAYTGYGVNYYGAMPREGETYYQPIHVDQAGIPGSALVIVSEVFRQTQIDTNGRDGWYQIFPTSTYDSLFTHQDAATTSFLDGHVEFMKSEKLGWSSTDRTWITGFDHKNSPWHSFIYTRK